MERLARPLSELRAHYDVVVVGSGYGGAIAACRLSRAGQSVALLERGREIHPGEYPSSMREAAAQVQISGRGLDSDGQVGDRRDLYWFHTEGDINVFSGCGLGGTSLVNANVSLQPDLRVFDERWPKELRRRDNKPEKRLEAGYEAAKAMLRPETYPDRYPRLPKVEALRLAAGRTGIVFTPVNVTFAKGPNAAGVHQEACTGCGDCVTGCNVSAKNTVLMNYLPDAAAHGASIFTEMNVLTVLPQRLKKSKKKNKKADKKAGSEARRRKEEGRTKKTEKRERKARKRARKARYGWVVHVEPLAFDEDRSVMSVTADVVVLAAGTLGTTEILLRSRRSGLSLSDQLGFHFTGNGDVIGFAERPRTVVRGIGAGPHTPDTAAPAGPCITACIDERSKSSVDMNLLIEDAVVPGAMAEPTALDLAAQLGAARQGWRRRIESGWEGLLSAIGGGHHGATEHLQTLLLMGHDDAEGRIVLEDSGAMTGAGSTGAGSKGAGSNVSGVNGSRANGASTNGRTGSGVHSNAGESLRIEWPDIATSDYYRRAQKALAESASRGDGTYIEDPLSEVPVEARLITVHPLGGCVMADSIDGGVVDHRGRVFAPARGLSSKKARDKRKTAVYEGLIVADGSVVPRPLGVNPLLTISALAERSMGLLCKERGWTLDTSVSRPRSPVDGSDAPPPSAAPGLRFTETMSGWWSIDRTPARGSLEPFLEGEARGKAEAKGKAEARGKADLVRPVDGQRPGHREHRHRKNRKDGKHGKDGKAGSRKVDGHRTGRLKAPRAGDTVRSAIIYDLTISTDDVRRVIGSLDTPMAVVGSVDAPRLSPDPLAVERGTFQAQVADEPSDPSVRHMRYKLPLVATDGTRYFLDGFKVISPGVLDDAWPATTTLYVTIRKGDVRGDVLGRGIMRIDPAGFIRLLRSMHITGPVGWVQRLDYEAKFAEKFAGPLVREYGRVFHHPSKFDVKAPRRRKRPLDVPPPAYFEYKTADGVTERLTRYKGGKSDPVLLSHGMGNSLTWSLDTVDRTLLETLVANGYDVWLQDWRSSTLYPPSHTQFNGDLVARFDHPAAAKLVATVTGRHELHVIAHCVGSITWMMSTLAGSVDPTSLLCSAVAVHPVAPTLTRFKVGMHLGEMLHRAGIRYLTTDSTRTESFWQRQFDRELRLYPIPKEEECDQAVCRRVAFIYGNGVHHANLNPATHTALHELFGVTNLTMMDHLSRMARAERVLGADGNDSYLVHLERLRRPITFVHGMHNLVWIPESTERSYELLRSRFGDGHYDRVVFPEYGHQDVLCGARASIDTHPAFLHHLERVNA